MRDKIQPDWWLKISAGAIAGLAIAFGCVGLFAWFGPGGLDAPVKGQFNMWMVAPIWLPLFAGVFLFKTGIRAWCYFGCIGAVLIGVNMMLKLGML